MSQDSRRRMTSYLAGAALIGAGMVGGAVLAGTMAASAAETDSGSTAVVTTDQTGSPAGSDAEHGDGRGVDPGQPMRDDEELLTGDTAAAVTDAALAQYPNATIQRVETDSDGVYEAHIVTSDGQALIVQVDKGFAVTGTAQMGEPR